MAAHLLSFSLDGAPYQSQKPTWNMCPRTRTVSIGIFNLPVVLTWQFKKWNIWMKETKILVFFLWLKPALCSHLFTTSISKVDFSKVDFYRVHQHLLSLVSSIYIQISNSMHHFLYIIIISIARTSLLCRIQSSPSSPTYSFWTVKTVQNRSRQVRIG